MNIRKLWGGVRFDQSYTEAVLGQKVKKPLFAFPEVFLSSLKTLNLVEKDEIPLIKTKIDLGIESNGELPEAYHVIYILGLIKTLRHHPQFDHHIHKFHTRNQGRLFRKIGQELCKKLCNAKDPIDKKIIDMFSDKQCVILNDEVSSYRQNKKIVDKLIRKQIPCQILQCRVLDRGYDEPKIDATGIFCTTKSFVSIWQFIFRGNRRNYDKPWDEDEQLIYVPRVVDDLSEDGKKIYWESTTNTIKEIATDFKPIIEWAIAQSTTNNPGTNPPEIKDPPPYISPVSFGNPQDWMNTIKEIVITHSGSLKQSIIKTLFIDMHKAALTEINNPKDNDEKRKFQLQDKWRNDPRIQVS